MENDINIDPIPLTVEEFAIAGDMDGKPCPPFGSLHVRVRQQIVADGLDRPLDWESAGYDMPPLEWHQKLKKTREARESGDEDKIKGAPLIFDCRNDYETSVGVFEGAETLDTQNFRDSWGVLKNKLKDKPKDTPIMTYCTGGIRCVKVGAYLTQEMGFTNVSRLAGGIIAYDRTLNDKAPDEEPMFKGTNYVFDGRVGRQITDDALGDCMTCGGKTNLLSNCMNSNCHKRMIQCDNCRDSYSGTCSEVCKNRVINSQSSFYERKATKNEVKYENLDDYALGYSTPPSDLYEEIKKNTAEFMGSGYHMISDTAQGRLLCNLASISREGRILEIGGFTGYATCCFLEGAANAADAIDNTDSPGNRERGAFVMSLERDGRAIDIAASHLDVMTSVGLGQDGAEKAAGIRGEGPGIPVIESDSILFEYKNAGCELIRVTDALAYVEAIASGIESENTRPFDIVFIDADKTRFLQYVEACLSSDRVLKTGGIMIVDNVLWKGIVLDVNNGTVNISNDSSDAQEVKKSRRARKLANAVHDFNSAIVNDSRVEVVMLNMRDGLSIIRKKKE
jgi:predicted sulfurtransferase